MEISIRGGQTRSAFFFFLFLYPRFIQKCIKKNFYEGGVPPKKIPRVSPLDIFEKISKKSPMIKKSQGSLLWIFWEFFQNFKKISNNGLLLKKNKILFSILQGGGQRKYGNFHTFFFEPFPKQFHLHILLLVIQFIAYFIDRVLNRQHRPLLES